MGLLVLVGFGAVLWVFHSNSALQPLSPEPGKGSTAFAVATSLLPLLLFAADWPKDHPEWFRLTVMFAAGGICSDLSLNPSLGEPHDSSTDRLKEFITDEVWEAVSLAIFGVLLGLFGLFISTDWWLWALGGVLLAIRVSRIPYLASVLANSTEGDRLKLSVPVFVRRQLKAAAVFPLLILYLDPLVRAAQLTPGTFTGFGQQSVTMLAAAGIGGQVTRLIVRWFFS